MSSTTMDSSALPGTTPSVGELSAEFAKQKRAKSPPLAFEKTSNDSLAPLTSPSTQTASLTDRTMTTTTLSHIMGRLSPPQPGEEQDLQVVVDQQAAAIQLLHDAFAAERQSWSLEKDRLYHRIANLEKLLKSGDANSPAKSPVLSPLNTSDITSPQSRAAPHSHRLPSIAEDEPILPLSQRRDQAPQTIEIPSPPSHPHQRQSAVAFQEDTPTAAMVQEFAVSPPPDVGALSPPPLINRMEAGHTPLRAPRPLTPPPQNSLSMDGIEDTPTRNNTHINAFLSRSSDEGEDEELKGPLNMPELPNRPDESNFTLEMLNKRLEQIEKNPSESTPMVVIERSPDTASPAAEPEDGEAAERSIEEDPLSPAPTRVLESSASELSSNARSPSVALSPLSKHASQEQSEEKLQAEFESGGIKLKKKASTNFGAPFGSLGGFGRRTSHDWQ